MLARLLPATVAVISLFAFLRFQGERHGLYGAAVGVVLFAVAASFLVTLLMVWTARSLDRAEACQAQLLTELEAARERFELAVKGSNDGIWDWDLSSGRVYYSPAFQRLLGHAEGNLLELRPPFLSLLHPADHAAVGSALEAHLEASAPFSLDCRLKSKAGHHLWFHARGEAVRDGSGKATRMAGSITDVTDRKRAEEELDRFFTLSQDLVCVAGFDGCFRRVNQAWERCLGLSRHELTSKPFTAFIHPDDVEPTFTAMSKLASGGHVKDFENRYRTADGSYRWLSWSATPLLSADLIYAVARDVTERKQVQEQPAGATLEELQAALPSARAESSSRRQG